MRRLLLLYILLIVSFVGNVALSLLLFQGKSIFMQSIPSIKGATDTELLNAPVKLAGSKEIKEFSVPLATDVLQGKDTLDMVIDLHGLCLLSAASSRVSFVDRENKRHSVSLRDYVKNCADGEQTVTISLSSFFENQQIPEVTSLEMQIWYPTSFDVDIRSISVYNRVLGKSTSNNTPRGRNKKTLTPTIVPSVTPTVTPTPTFQPTLALSPTPTMTFTPTPTTIVSPTPTLQTINTWSIRSISSMKVTKDQVCSPRDAVFIRTWVDTAYELGVTHIAVETPYDNPSCGSAVFYTKAWVDAIHAKGLGVWHRHMPLAFEGIYNTSKNNSIDYLAQISSYILANPTFFRVGDIFTPIPEPQNGGIQGITYCPQGICMYSGKTHFNTWLRDAITTSENAFASIGLGGQIKIGYYGFDGFVAWGDNNPDWSGILEDATIAKMGNITIDHYPEIVGDTMENDLNELQAKYPNVPIIIGEWGTITGGDIEQQVRTSMQAARRPNVVGFNYWHMGMGGNEALINDDFSKRAQYDEVQSFYR